MSHGYDHILELEFEEKERKLEKIASEVLKDNLSEMEMDEIIWMWKNKSKIIRNKRLIETLT